MLLTAASLALSLFAAQPPGVVEVRLSGVRAQGDLYVQLCTEAEGMTNSCAHGQVVKPRGAGALTVRFSGVAPGRYAAAAYQDIDGNGRISFGMMGRPTDPWGYSRGARGVMGPPNFSQAAVSIGANGGAVDVQLGL